MPNEPRIDQVYSVPLIGLDTLGYNDIPSTTPRKVLDPDPNRRTIVFHNPSNVQLAISQLSDFTFGPPKSGGTLIMLAPGGYQFVEGDPAQGPWYALAKSGHDKAITIIPGGQIFPKPTGPFLLLESGPYVLQEDLQSRIELEFA
jgi:hypothetical protein